MRSPEKERFSNIGDPKNHSTSKCVAESDTKDDSYVGKPSQEVVLQPLCAAELTPTRRPEESHKSTASKILSVVRSPCVRSTFDDIVNCLSEASVENGRFSLALQVQNLSSLLVSESAFQYFFDCVAECAAKMEIDSLDLSHLNLGDKGAVYLATFLKDPRTASITSLNVSDAGLTKFGNRILFNALRLKADGSGNKNLKELTIGNFSSEIASSFDKESKRLLRRFNLAKELNLDSLIISHTPDDDKAKPTYTIKKFLLEDSAAAATPRTRKPKRTSSFEYELFDFSCLDFKAKRLFLKEDGCHTQLKLISDALRDRRITKIKIDLSFNLLNFSAPDCLNRFLRPHLEHLTHTHIDLSHNKINGGDRDYIKDLLMLRSLKTLNVSHNGMSREMTSELLVQAFKNNRNLEVLDIGGSKVSEACLPLFIRALLEAKEDVAEEAVASSCAQISELKPEYRIRYNKGNRENPIILEFVLDVSYLRNFKETEEGWKMTRIESENDPELELAFLKEFLEDFRKKPHCVNIEDSFVTPRKHKPISRSSAIADPTPQTMFELLAAAQLSSSKPEIAALQP